MNINQKKKKKKNTTIKSPSFVKLKEAGTQLCIKLALRRQLCRKEEIRT